MTKRVQSLFLSTLLLAATCAFTTNNKAFAQTYFTASGYIPITDLGPSPVSVLTGYNVGFNVSALCPVQSNPGIEPTVTFYVSNSPNSLGTNVGSSLLDPDATTVGWNAAMSGTYYVSAYLNLDGAANCNGGPAPTSTPQQLVLSVAN